MTERESNAPIGSSVSMGTASSYARRGFTGLCPECGAQVVITDSPTCPGCMIVLSVAPGVSAFALSVFLVVVVGFGASAGASMLAMHALHRDVAGSGVEPLRTPYPVLVLAVALQFACVIHGVLVAIGLLERVRFLVLWMVLLELAGALGLAAFIVWRAYSGAYY